MVLSGAVPAPFQAVVFLNDLEFHGITESAWSPALVEVVHTVASAFTPLTDLTPGLPGFDLKFERIVIPGTIRCVVICASAPAYVISFNLFGFTDAYVVTTLTTLETSHIRLDLVRVLVLILIFDSLIHLVAPVLWFIPESVACICVVGSVWSAKITFKTAFFAPVPIPFDIIILVVRISTVPTFLHVGILY